MKISFILPPPTVKIAGGYKIVYEYANRLVRKGYEVNIIYDSRKGVNSKALPKFLVYFMRFLITKIEPTWFLLDSKVNKILVKEVNNKNIPNGDIVVATAADTVMDVLSLAVTKGKKVYLIQDYEDWHLTEEELHNTYKFGFANIVISTWLKNIVDGISNKESVYIANGIDFDNFGIDRSIENRTEKSISMLYHTDKRKGSDLGLQVIDRLKSKYPNLVVNMFGVPPKPKNLGNYIIYTRKANQKQLRYIYNNSAVFLCTSYVEGFGLTGAESMACGCALVSTKCQGVLEYAVDNESALLAEIGNEEEIFNRIVDLFDNQDLRIQIAKKGNLDIKKLSWDKSIEKFESVLRIK